MAALEREEPYLYLGGNERHGRLSQVIHIIVSRDVACVREEDQLAKLPAPLRERLRAAWKVVDRVWKRVR